MTKNRKTWLDNFLVNLFYLLVSAYPAWNGYKDYLDLQAKDVVYIINDILPIPGEFVMILWFAVAAIIAIFALSGIYRTLKRRFKGDMRYYIPRW
jgi:phosphoglycerol transferase MdoB-like AlkP superfamily enzyme